MISYLMFEFKQNRIYFKKKLKFIKIISLIDVNLSNGHNIHFLAIFLLLGLLSFFNLISGDVNFICFSSLYFLFFDFFNTLSFVTPLLLWRLFLLVFIYNLLMSKYLLLADVDDGIPYYYSTFFVFLKSP